MGKDRRGEQSWKLRFLLRGEKISVFRASPAEEITPIISRASLEAFAEKSLRMANSSGWCYLDCSLELLAEENARVENLHEI